jgi:phospholipid/cholesterol/gamma-HCH transport system ATP-binding protein
VAQGELVAVIGGSGSGKSVLLKHIAGLIKPDSGKIYINGKEITAISKKELEEVRQGFGFLFQGGALFDSLTVYENVAFPLREKTKLSKKEIDEKVNTYLELVGLKGSEAKYPSQISGGMIKRAALARALITDPKIMLFDEPTTGLDPQMSLSILDLIGSVHRRLNLTGIIVTHAIPTVFRITKRVLMIYQGKIYFDGTPEGLKASESQVIKGFLGDWEG